MRFTRFALVLSVAGVVGLLALNLRAQLRTQEKLDALAAALAERAAVTPQPVGPTAPPAPGSVPRELDHPVALPPYVIEAPDVLTIEAVLKDPKTGATDRLPTQPISGSFLVRPDGTVGLGVWGSVSVTGLTTEQASAAIRAHLAKSRAAELSAENLAVVVDVQAYNSKCYYVITDAPGGGEQVLRLPLAGNETVLDAIAQVGGLPEAAGKKSVHIARPRPSGGNQILPVDWKAITRQGVTATNYQLMPADRVYVGGAGE